MPFLGAGREFDAPQARRFGAVEIVAHQDKAADSRGRVQLDIDGIDRELPLVTLHFEQGAASLAEAEVDEAVAGHGSGNVGRVSGAILS